MPAAMGSCMGPFMAAAGRAVRESLTWAKAAADRVAAMAMPHSVRAAKDAMA